VIDDNLHRNYIDHAEYPQTFEIQQRCIRMLAELFHAPGETTGARSIRPRTCTAPPPWALLTALYVTE